MSHNTFGHLFRVTTWGESHGPAIGAIVDGCPPGIALDESDIQGYLDKRKPGQSRFTTQRQEADAVTILSGVFADASGKQVTTGTPIALEIQNTDQRSKDYGDIKDKYRPGHADRARIFGDDASAGRRAGRRYLAMVESLRIDLVIVGHRRSKKFALRWWRGSVDSLLIERVRCSILIAGEPAHVEPEPVANWATHRSARRRRQSR